MALKFTSGNVTVTATDLTPAIEAALKGADLFVFDTIEAEAGGAFDTGEAEWPVKTGRSKAGLQFDMVVWDTLDRVGGRTTNSVAHWRFIRFGRGHRLKGKHVLTTLITRPMRLARDRVVDALIGLEEAMDKASANA